MGVHMSMLTTHYYMLHRIITHNDAFNNILDHIAKTASYILISITLKDFHVHSLYVCF